MLTDFVCSVILLLPLFKISSLSDVSFNILPNSGKWMSKIFLRHTLIKKYFWHFCFWPLIFIHLTIWKFIVYNLFCRDWIYFDKILVSKYKLFVFLNWPFVISSSVFVNVYLIWSSTPSECFCLTSDNSLFAYCFFSNGIFIYNSFASTDRPGGLFRQDLGIEI
jgi:hypothetical protein